MWVEASESGTDGAQLALYDSTGGVYQSVGLLELTAIPDVGESVIIGGTSYTFVNGASPLGDDNIQIDGGRSLSQVVADFSAPTPKTTRRPASRGSAGALTAPPRSAPSAK